MNEILLILQEAIYRVSEIPGYLLHPIAIGLRDDTRMSAEVLRVITACDDKSRLYYPTTLFTAEEAHAGPCTAKGTIYCANIAAGFMLAQFTKYLRLLPVDPDIQVNLLASEIHVVDVCGL